MDQFTALKRSIEALDDKIDKILIREAHRDGEAVGNRRTSALIATIISLVIGVAAVVAGVVI
jgi:hypothetical protein